MVDPTTVQPVTMLEILLLLVGFVVELDATPMVKSEVVVTPEALYM
jgi:hypothetical protein